MQGRGVFSRHNLRADYSGLEPKTEKDSSSADISEFLSKGDRFESLHEYLFPACEFL
jgi:hypothetical protein